MAGSGSAWRAASRRTARPSSSPARNADKTAKAVRELQGLGAKASGIAVDVKDEASVKAMVADTVERYGRLDILVNNAGINVRKPPHELSLAEWHEVLETNLTSAFLASHAAYPHMKKGGGGKIINIGSMMSIFGAAFAPAYAASKGGIVQFTKVCANRLGQGQHPGQCRAAGLDRHRAHAGAAGPRSRASTIACLRARRRAAGACPTISPASPCSCAAPRRIS